MLRLNFQLFVQRLIGHRNGYYVRTKDLIIYVGESSKLIEIN